jgi:spore coat protein CotH
MGSLGQSHFRAERMPKKMPSMPRLIEQSGSMVHGANTRLFRNQQTVESRYQGPREDACPNDTLA